MFAEYLTFLRLKVESVHYPNGQAALAPSAHHPGSVHYYSIFLSNRKRYADILEKNRFDAEITDVAELHDEYPRHWASVWDNAYQGASEHIRAFVIKKGQLSPEEEERNLKLLKIRVIAENFYGRLKSLWGICRETYRGEHYLYDYILSICFAFTNYHLEINPLVQE